MGIDRQTIGKKKAAMIAALKVWGLLKEPSEHY